MNVATQTGERYLSLFVIPSFAAAIGKEDEEEDEEKEKDGKEAPEMSVVDMSIARALLTELPLVGRKRRR